MSCARFLTPRSPVVMKRVPSGENTSREPKWRVTLVFFAIEKMTSTSSRRAEPPSRTSFARATAVPAPPLPGSEKLKKTRLELAKSGAATMSSNPPWPRAATLGTPPIGSDNRPSRDRMRTRPGRSVTIASPSGRKSSPQGFCSPSAIVSASIGTASVWKVADCANAEPPAGVTAASKEQSSMILLMHRM